MNQPGLLQGTARSLTILLRKLDASYYLGRSRKTKVLVSLSRSSSLLFMYVGKRQYNMMWLIRYTNLNGCNLDICKSLNKLPDNNINFYVVPTTSIFVLSKTVLSIS